jgi:alkanesulfonate monooxygenase SsuD/methylene tetrahydromethanopterin reductase-like flavin-dependent oxidoreductase (luciferase family)
MKRPAIGMSVSMHPIDEMDPAFEAAEAERLGFDFVSVADHPFGGSQTNEPLVTLAWVAAATHRIGLVTRVLAVPFRHPAMVAKMAETLDRLAGERLVLGLGGGGADDKMASVGIGPLRPRDKIDSLTEAAAVIRGLWSEQPFGFAGTHHRVAGAVLSPRPERRIPIWFGVMGERGAEAAGAFADGWIPHLRYISFERLAACGRRLTVGAEKAGRDPAAIRRVLSVEVRVGDFPDGPRNAVTGSPEQVAERLAELLTLGFDGINISVLGPSRAEQAGQLAEQVLPLLPGWTDAPVFASRTVVLPGGAR